jgi:three-Cys-motif partner protein
LGGNVKTQIDTPYLKLKQVSRAKHTILRKYLEPWAKILGTAYPRLGYFDCYAGGGIYTDENGQPMPGSPLIAVDIAKEWAKTKAGRLLLLGFVEKNHNNAVRLRRALNDKEIPSNLDCRIFEEESERFIEELCSTVKPGSKSIPTFFFVDPYGHPISVPAMRTNISGGERSGLWLP